MAVHGADKECSSSEDLHNVGSHSVEKITFVNGFYDCQNRRKFRFVEFRKSEKWFVVWFAVVV